MNRFKQNILYQIFEAYTYTIVLLGISSKAQHLKPHNIHGNYFIFKTSPRAYYSLSGSNGNTKYSYFSFTTTNNNDYALLMNPQINIGDRAQHHLSPDIVIAEIDGQIQEPIPREMVAFIGECKSVSHGTMEHVATVMGQRFLIKRKIVSGSNHPYENIVDMLIIRGKASASIKSFLNYIRNWKHRIGIADEIYPGSPNVQVLQSEISKLTNKL